MDAEDRLDAHWQVADRILLSKALDATDRAVTFDHDHRTGHAPSLD
jgi:hypothetical protein